MGWLDRTKAALGLGQAPKGLKSDGRPPLKDLPPACPAASLDDALEARAAGRADEARAILRAIDRGKGLRTVLRAGAALEAGDEEELAPLVRSVATSEVAWRLAIQIATAMSPNGDSATAPRATRDRLVAFAAAHGAPVWALSWAQSTSSASVKGKVAFLFADAPLARTVAAREWKVEGAQEDRSAIDRYATFAHGRDLIARFGPLVIAEVFARAFEPKDDAT
jgi:hypothetical protein